MYWAGTIWAAVVAQKDSIEIGVWAFGLVALFFTFLQFRDANSQRNLTESFLLFEKLDGHLADWSRACRDPQIPDADFRIAVGRLLSTYELISDAINRHLLSPMARKALNSQILDSLEFVPKHERTSADLIYLCHNDGVCRSLKLFMLNNRKKLNRNPHFDAALQSMFTETDRALFRAGVRNFANRAVAKFTWRYG